MKVARTLPTSRTRMALLVSIGSALMPFGLLLSQHSRFIHLGESLLGFSQTSTYVPADSNKGTVCSVRFQIQNGGIEANRVLIHFANSETLNVPINFKLQGESNSPSIALPGNRRAIKGVEVDYVLRSHLAGRPTLVLSGDTLPGSVYCPR